MRRHAGHCCPRWLASFDSPAAVRGGTAAITPPRTAARFEKLGIGRANESLVFDHAGEPWHPDTFGTEFARRARLFNLSLVRLHDLRHPYASLMLESGVDLNTVSQALGHSTIRITADTYAHVTPAMRQSATERLDRIIGSRETP